MTFCAPINSLHWLIRHVVLLDWRREVRGMEFLGKKASK